MLYDQVYTVGFFNNFHLGHLELLNSMRKKGKKLFVGVYDDQHLKISKNLKPYEYQPLEVRLEKIKEYAEVVFVIPSLDPEMYLRMIVDPSKNISKCFMKGGQDQYYTGWKWIKNNMNVILIDKLFAIKN